LEKAALRTADPLIFDHLGDACLADHHPEEAVQAWSKVLSMDPKNEPTRKKLMTDGQRFLGSAEGSRYPKYLEGNFKQVQTLHGDLNFEGQLSKRALKTEGRLSYVQPDGMQLAIPATGKTSAMTFVLHGKTRRVDPDQTSSALSQLAFEGMSALAQLFSGTLTNGLRPTINAQTGVQSTFERPNLSGGQDELTLVSYDFVEGLWLPTEIHVTNATTGWKAQLKFSDWIVNGPEKAAVTK
jgi:hypothetical protein